MKIYMGWDSREEMAYRVAERSIRERSPYAPEIVPLRAEELRRQGLLMRPMDQRRGRWDLISNAPASTEFAISRFLTPFLAQSGWALFIDCDIVCLDDITLLEHITDPDKAVMVVKHDNISRYPTGPKMDGQEQSFYARKNWSSVMLINCDHPANRRLTLHDVNTRTGRELHAFYWLHDDEIGELPAHWNWLVGVDPKPAQPSIAHFTLGGPWLPTWKGAEHDEIWRAEAAKL